MSKESVLAEIDSSIAKVEIDRQQAILEASTISSGAKIKLCDQTIDQYKQLKHSYLRMLEALEAQS